MTEANVLYAPTNNREHIPIGWEEVEYLWKKFGYYGGAMEGYQLIWERKMFSTQGPEFRCCLRKWSRRGLNPGLQPPEVLLVTHDPNQMAAVLLMLVKEAEVQHGENGF